MRCLQLPFFAELEEARTILIAVAGDGDHHRVARTRERTVVPDASFDLRASR